jgi:hypothetical protein
VRYEATTIHGFIQQVAVGHVQHGYWFYVPGVLPEGKDPRALDEKLTTKYEVGISKWTRARRKRAGAASIAYLRHDRFFVLLATHGRHPFFEEEAARLRDLRREPFKFASYAVSHRAGHAHVRIEAQTFRDLKAYFDELATKRSAEWLGQALHDLPFEPYAPIRGQFCELLRRINSRRRTAGLESVPGDCLRLRRRIYRPFS